jgi:hypothetical protein
MLDAVLAFVEAGSNLTVAIVATAKAATPTQILRRVMRVLLTLDGMIGL